MSASPGMEGTMQASLNTASFCQPWTPVLKSEDPLIAVRIAAEECRRRAREATAKAQTAADSNVKRTWLLTANRWHRLAEEIDQGKLLHAYIQK